MQKAQRLLKNDLIKIAPSDLILEASRLMSENKIRHLPVFEKENIVGILSDRDIKLAKASKKVSDYMNWPVYSVLESVTLRTLIEEMITHKISAVLVQNAGLEYVGIVTTEDILIEFLKILGKEDEMKEKSLSYFLPNILY